MAIKAPRPVAGKGCFGTAISILARVIFRHSVTRWKKFMILEAVILNVKSGMESDFELALSKASTIIASMGGYLSHELHRCLEVQGRYLLLVKWENLEAHTVGFRGSIEYQEWKKLLHHFYEPFPTVEHFEQVKL
jgi:heme-degrading monooxygenase HmoA